MIIQDFLFCKCREGICWVSKWIVNTSFIYQAVNIISFTHKNDVVWGFICADNNIFVMEVGQVFCNIWVFSNVMDCHYSTRYTALFFVLISYLFFFLLSISLYLGCFGCFCFGHKPDVKLSCLRVIIIWLNRFENILSASRSWVVILIWRLINFHQQSTYIIIDALFDTIKVCFAPFKVASGYREEETEQLLTTFEWKIGRCGMIARETTLHHKTNDVKVDIFWSTDFSQKKRVEFNIFEV